ncbi:MAG: hypothetical protein COB37_00305 [Kordiimonadales bacterium]|nr:MAG: hypothetical protein COB37_00305 [Kordiimonadales bacterium]
MLSLSKSLYWYSLAASALVAGAAIPTHARASDTLELSAILETQTALGFKQGDLQKNEFIFKPELGFDFGSSSRFTLIGRIRGDSQGRLEPGRPPGINRAAFSGRVFAGDHLEAEILEAYIDTDIGNTFLRIGKQQIVWGQADGLKVLDILNPQSFREFILPEFEDSRIALWAVNAEIPVGEALLQLIWIPDTTYDDIPEQGAAFAFTSPLVVPQAPIGVPVNFRPLDKPSNAFTDSDVGVKLSAFLGGWDVSLNYAYHYVDRPVVRRSVSDAGITITQNYERSHLVGGTAATVFGDFALRAEIGYSTNRFFRTSDQADADGVVRANEFSYVVGLDYSGFTDWFLSAQVFQSRISNFQPGIVRAKTDTSLTFLIRRNFMNETLSAEALVIQSVADNDGLLQLAMSYQWSSNVRLKAGADFFYGSSYGLFGQFRDRDRVTLGIEVSF